MPDSAVSEATAYRERVAELHCRLGIPDDYAARFRLNLQEEASDLVVVGPDPSGREQRLTPATARAWQALREAASHDGLALLLISGFRSAQYQHDLIARKLDAGKSLAEILRINAAPGYSEHHTGRALDLSSPDCPPLETGFESTAAFAWLQKHARRHGFRLSYPRDNPHGILYEPWHWYYTG